MAEVTVSDPESPSPPPPSLSPRKWIDLVLDRFGAAVLGGFLTGLLIGGVGGRLAMFVLRLNSDDSLRGLNTDDEFEIGQISSGTFFLLAITTVLGCLFAVAYLAVRRWLPARVRPAQMAVFFGLLGGSAVIKPDGLDFSLLDPLPLAVAMFIALPAAYGAAMAWTVEWLLAHPGSWRRTRIAVLPLFAVVGLFALVSVITFAAFVLVVLLSRSAPGLRRLGEHPAVTWGVRTVLVVLAVLFTSQLVSDVTEIL